MYHCSNFPTILLAFHISHMGSPNRYTLIYLFSSPPMKYSWSSSLFVLSLPAILAIISYSYILLFPFWFLGFFLTSVLYLVFTDFLDSPWCSPGWKMSMADRDWTSCIIRNQHIHRCHFSCNLPFLSLPPVTHRKKLVLLEWRGIGGEPFLRAQNFTARG